MEVPKITLEEQFELFAKFGDPNANGETITLTQIDKWLKQAKLLHHKNITNTETGICFNKFKTRTIDFVTFLKFLDDVASLKAMSLDELKEELVKCGMPGTKPVTQAPPPKKPLEGLKENPA